MFALRYNYHDYRDAKASLRYFYLQMFPGVQGRIQPF